MWNRNYIPLDYWVFGLCPSSSILTNTAFRKQDLFPSSSDGVGDTYSVVSVSKINPNHWTMSHWAYLLLRDSTDWHPLPHLRTETDPVSEMSCLLEYLTMEKVQKSSNPECYTASSEPYRIDSELYHIRKYSKEIIFVDISNRMNSDRRHSMQEGTRRRNFSGIIIESAVV
jgi:hypothetical protein